MKLTKNTQMIATLGICLFGACPIVFANSSYQYSPIQSNTYVELQELSDSLVAKNDYDNQRAWVELRAEAANAEIQADSFINGNGTLHDMACAAWSVVAKVQLLRPTIKKQLTNPDQIYLGKSLLRFDVEVSRKLGKKPTDCTIN